MAEFPTKRIINLDEQSAPQSGDYIVTDNQTSGTKKTPASALATSQALAAEATARQQADEAEAQARANAISAEQTAREQAIEAEQTAREEADDALTESVTALSDEVTAQGALIQNPTKTVSGSIAHFTDGAAMPAESVVVTIEPQQSGTGTPSPDNVRQISGWESVNVDVAGGNLIDVSTNQSGAIDGSGNEVENPVFNRTDFIPIDKAMVYVKTSAASGYTIRVHGYSSSKAWVQQLKLIATSGTALLVGETVPNNVAYVRMSYPIVGVDNTELWQADTTPVNLGRTVYGGTLDVVSGVLTAYPYYPSYNGETLNGRWVCDRAVYSEGVTPPTGSQVALISGTGTTYTLTPTQINTLLGENNVWADAGAVEVTYRRDINLALEQLEALLNSTETASQTASTAETSEA